MSNKTKINFKKNPYRGILKTVSRQIKEQTGKDVSVYSLSRRWRSRDPEIIPYIVSEIERRKKLADLADEYEQA